MVCPIQQPSDDQVKAYENRLLRPQKRNQDSVVEAAKADPFSLFLPNPSPKRSRVLVVDGCYAVVPASCTNKSCVLEFDGASKGNPGVSGAGAVLRADDGTVIKLREGVGIATNNVAEYRAILLGLKYALSKGFNQIRVRGDSKLVVMQVRGLWQCRNANMTKLCREVVELKSFFSSFQIEHVLRVYKAWFYISEYNSDTDDQANLAVSLRDAEVQVDIKKYAMWWEKTIISKQVIQFISVH